MKKILCVLSSVLLITFFSCTTQTTTTTETTQTDDQTDKENSDDTKTEDSDKETENQNDDKKDDSDEQTDNQEKEKTTDDQTSDKKTDNQNNDDSDEKSDETKSAKTVDFEITETDLGKWTNNLSISAEKFSEMVSGDYITITSKASSTSSDTPQLGLCDGEWNSIGSETSCTNISSYSSEYKCYSLNAAAQDTVFTPSDSELTTLKEKGLIIKGQGISISKVTVRINANLDSDTNPTDNTSQENVNSDLSDKSATENAKHLYKYLRAMYGSKVITGQMENAWNDDCNMLNRVYSDTGKYPALMGFDFMNYTSLGYTTTNVQTERAINFWNGKDYDGNTIADGNHGIVAFMWHWRDPTAASGNTGSYTPGDGTNDTTTFRIPYDTETDSWNTSTTEYKEMIADLDTIAAELTKLQTAGVPVLWRPMHEGAGNLGGNWTGAAAWFWWGAGNDDETAASTNLENCSECYIALWKLMYSYFTETKNLHNLIWVWNGQNQNFYPGSSYVDIIGDDIYETAESGADSCQKYNTNKSKFTTFQSWDSTKLTTLTECGNLPDITTDGALWSYFMIWNDGNYESSAVTTNTHKDNFWSGTYYNTSAKKNEIYVTCSAAITLDELPDLTTY